MIDVGISGKRVECGMNDFGYTTSDMEAILITHEHSDHISGLGVISRKYGLPIYATRGTIDAVMMCGNLGTIDPSLFHVIEPDCDVTIGELTIHPIRVSHDAAEPVAYLVKDDKHKVGVITDLGEYDDYIIDNISGLDAMLLEANHDIKMLQAGPYPYPLKQRILSARGHLSNESSGKLLSSVLHDDMDKVLLGHLSHENNYSELALESVKMEITLSDTPYKGTDFDISIASRDKCSKRIMLD